jgi:hypothetical protein
MGASRGGVEGRLARHRRVAGTRAGHGHEGTEAIGSGRGDTPFALLAAAVARLALSSSLRAVRVEVEQAAQAVGVHQ